MCGECNAAVVEEGVTDHEGHKNQQNQLPGPGSVEKQPETPGYLVCCCADALEC